MPNYSYLCEECKYVFKVWRSLSQADQPAPCPECASEHTRRSYQAPYLSGASASSGGSSGCGSCAPASAASCAGCSVRR